MKTCHPSSIGAPVNPLRSSNITAPLHRVACTLALTVLGASSTLAQIGANYCTPAVPNSTGAPAVIVGSGSAVVPLNNLVLTSTNLPQHVWAYFLCSRTPGFVSSPGGSAGNLCLGNPIGRFVGAVIVNSGTTGSVHATADLDAMPQPIGAAVVMPGETWNFQCWYRDTVPGGNATSNFSDGLEVLFTASPVPTMVPIPAGTFMMGSNAGNIPPYYSDPIEQPVHQVTISYAFWMGQYEVTQAEYQALMGTNPSYHFGANLPVEQVGWYEARQYCAALTAQQAGNVPVGFEYRLPTEAEWEYACRAGTTTEFHYGPALFCHEAKFWHSYHTNPPAQCPSFSSSVPVGSYAPNAFGLHDMHGNVWEWCLDSRVPYSSAPVTDPFVTGVGTNRIVRGGSWDYYSYSCRSAFRSYYYVPGTLKYLGFRVVLAPVLVP